MVPAPGVVPYGGGGGTADCPCVDASGSNTCRRWRQAGLCVDPVTAQSCQVGWEGPCCALRSGKQAMHIDLGTMLHLYLTVRIV